MENILIHIRKQTKLTRNWHTIENRHTQLTHKTFTNNLHTINTQFTYFTLYSFAFGNIIFTTSRTQIPQSKTHTPTHHVVRVFPPTIHSFNHVVADAWKADPKELTFAHCLQADERNFSILVFRYHSSILPHWFCSLQQWAFQFPNLWDLVLSFPTVQHFVTS